MYDQALGVAYIGQVPPQLQGFDKALAGGASPFQIKRKDRSGTLGKVMLGQRMVRIVRKTGIAHLLHLRTAGQEARHLDRVLDMPLHPERKGLQAKGIEKGVKGTKVRSQVAQDFGS